MKFLVFLLCATVALGARLEKTTPTKIKDFHVNPTFTDLRIIGGNAATLGQFPWQVAIIYETNEGSYFCGGSVISKEWILTAAHCADGALYFTLYFGTINLNYPKLVMTTTTSIVHPGYNSQTLNNDIALVKLNSPLTFTDTIKRIKLPCEGDVVGQGAPVTISGWGLTSDDDYYVSNTLNYVQLTTICNSRCAAVYGPYVIVNSTVCAVGSPYESTCFGDSGGPLVVYDTDGKATQVGVVSFVSDAGCASGNPSGYVRVESFLDWIALNTGKEIC